MKIPRELSGGELARRWGYENLHQVGSHISLQHKYRRRIVSPFPHTRPSASERSMEFCERWRITKALTGRTSSIPYEAAQPGRVNTPLTVSLWSGGTQLASVPANIPVRTSGP